MTRWGEVVGSGRIADLPGRPSPRYHWLRAVFRKTIHLLSYHFFLKRRTTIVSRVAGFRLVVPPTVFHPWVFVTSGFFASFVDGLDLGGKQVAEVGTGTGILALAAARAGATTVVAIDINPNAVRAVEDNAKANGLNQRVRPVCANLFSAIAPRPLFDVILSSPPSFAGEPLDLADRAWHAGPNYRDIASLFDQARERLAADGCFYVLLSSHSDLELLGRLIEQARFHARPVAQRSLLFETIIIYELRAGERISAAREVNTPDQW
jgi:release factor glutamine methyltransferase